MLGGHIRDPGKDPFTSDSKSLKGSNCSFYVEKKKKIVNSSDSAGFIRWHAGPPRDSEVVPSNWARPFKLWGKVQKPEV